MTRYTKSEEMLNRALKSIPLGAQTFTKSYTQFPLGVSPYFATHGEGAWLFDVDGNKYVDFVNGLLSITLGYNDPDVNKAVIEQVSKGSIFSLSSELEIEVAEQIIKMVPCAERVRFGKNGSDATAGAVRLARAYTGKEQVFSCGYHGWQDWYIGSTTKDLGVPKGTKELTSSFVYNDLDSLEVLFSKFEGKVAAIIMEPVNFIQPEEDYLKNVKEIAHKNGALLIFDETITGFRFSNGGAQELFDVTPDLATFGKGLANGYPLSAIAGRAEVMNLMDEIFFSFTFGGEALSLAAAKAVLHKLGTEPIVSKMNETGSIISSKLHSMIAQFEVDEFVEIKGFPVWKLIQLNDFLKIDSFSWKTLFLQEMFEAGIITIGTHNISYAHNIQHIETLLLGYERFFEKVNLIKKGRPLENFLKAEPIKPLFKVR